MDAFTELFDICILLAGVYMLYSAMTGKGSLYKTDNVKKGKEKDYRKFTRLFCTVGGVVAVAQGALDHFRVEPYATILFILLCVVVVAFCVLNVVYGNGRDKESRLR